MTQAKQNKERFIHRRATPESSTRSLTCAQMKSIKMLGATSRQSEREKGRDWVRARESHPAFPADPPPKLPLLRRKKPRKPLRAYQDVWVLPRVGEPDYSYHTHAHTQLTITQTFLLSLPVCFCWFSFEIFLSCVSDSLRVCVCVCLLLLRLVCVVVVHRFYFLHTCCVYASTVMCIRPRNALQWCAIRNGVLICIYQKKCAWLRYSVQKRNCVWTRNGIDVEEVGEVVCNIMYARGRSSLMVLVHRE